MIDIRLKVFKSVADNLSFTKAAQELFISQPAISKHIQELEKEYNTRLFDRMGNKIQLTTGGQLLLEHTIRILEAYQQLDYKMKALQQKSDGELRIGASTTISQYVMPKIIADFRRRYPQIRITMLSGNSRQVEEALSNERIDIGMVEGVSRQPSFRYTPFMRDELVAIVRPQSPYSRWKDLTPSQIKEVPIVLREPGSGSLETIRQAFKSLNISLSALQIEMYFGTTEGIKNFVEHTDCVGIISIRSVSKELYDGRFKLLEFKDFSIERDFTIVEKQGENGGLTQLLKDFIIQGYKS